MAGLFGASALKLEKWRLEGGILGLIANSTSLLMELELPYPVLNWGEVTASPFIGVLSSIAIILILVFWNNLE
jgi:hypothetical protein